jgi:hypothetical protein
MRVLAWNGDVLYASRGYHLFRAQIGSGRVSWEYVSRYRPQWWRGLSSRVDLTSRLLRDGFHGLAVLPSGTLVGAVPGAIVSLRTMKREFRVTHRLLRGTRPLHLTATPAGQVLWGEYFDNPERDEVHIYCSKDDGAGWIVAHTFAKGEIRHVHKIVCDPWEDCLWVSTGDNGSECRIIRATSDFRQVDLVLAGHQQVRSAALIPTQQGVFFSSDTPFETNHIYHLDPKRSLRMVADLPSSSIYGCCTTNAMFFSTMVEPSETNPTREVCVYGSVDGYAWHKVLSWEKDAWPMGLFQYGNAIFPGGNNDTDVLAVTTVAVKDDDLQATLWRVSSQ